MRGRNGAGLRGFKIEFPKDGTYVINQVQRLTIDDKEIILIPTAHVSQESVKLVKQVIAEEQPDSVCIELDAKRFENIKNPKAWEETDIVSVVKNKQVGFMIANLALSSYQKKLAEKLGTKPGAEMLQAIESAEEIGADLVLADREIQTTFLRIWRKLGLWEKCKLIVGIFFSFDDEEEEELGEDDLAKLLEGDTLEGMIADIDDELPMVGDVLIHERDQYLSDKIKHAPGKKVVAVLGGAHVPGIMTEIHNDIDLEEISTLPKKSPIGKIIGWTIPIVIIALIIFGFVTNLQTGLEQVGTWVLWNSGLAALFTLLAAGHPLTILTSLVLAPFTSLNPTVAVGWFSGLMQASIMKPQVKDLHDIPDDIFSLKGFYRNKVLKVFLVIIMANIGSSIGTFVAGADIITNLFG